MVFPEEQPSSFFVEAKNFFFSLFRSKSEMEQLKPLSFANAQLLSLRSFLCESFELLRNLESHTWSKMPSLEKVVGEVYSIYVQLRKRKTYRNGVQSDDWVETAFARVKIFSLSSNLNRTVVAVLKLIVTPLPPEHL
jgi:hypothetical protein